MPDEYLCVKAGEGSFIQILPDQVEFILQYFVELAERNLIIKVAVEDLEHLFYDLRLENSTRHLLPQLVEAVTEFYARDRPTAIYVKIIEGLFDGPSKEFDALYTFLDRLFCDLCVFWLDNRPTFFFGANSNHGAQGCNK